MKHVTHRLRSDRGDADPLLIVVFGAAIVLALLLVFMPSIYRASLQDTSFTRICGDERTYTRVSVDRCSDHKVGAQWLYVEEGHRLPRMGDDVSNAATRPHGDATIHTAER